MPVVKCVTSCPVFHVVVCRSRRSSCCQSLLSLSCRDSCFAGGAPVLLLVNHLLLVWIIGVDLGLGSLPPTRCCVVELSFWCAMMGALLL
jgi:hypothetical protein